MSNYAYKVMLQETPNLAHVGYNVVTSLPTSNTDVAQSVADQANTPDLVMMQVLPSTKNGDFSGVGPYCQAAMSHINIQAVYLYDELFYDHVNGIQIGLHGAGLMQAADVAHSYGYYTAITILPEVILHPDFQFGPTDLNRLDVIGIDVYPSLGVDWSLADGCTYSNNLYTNMLYLAYTKLRSLGYTGLVWYVFQGFGVSTDTDLVNKLTLQQDTIANAHLMGITGLVNWGFYPYSGITAPLYPGYGSSIESLVAAVND